MGSSYYTPVQIRWAHKLDKAIDALWNGKAPGRGDQVRHIWKEDAVAHDMCDPTIIKL